MNADIDVRPILPSVRVPTRVLYTPERADVARYVADRMPNVELAAYTDEFVSETDEFLERVWSEWKLRQAAPERVLATVLFTDLVRSTETAINLGPRWADVCVNTTYASAANSPDTPAARSIPQATVSSPPDSTAPRERFAAPARSEMRSAGSGSAYESASTPENATWSTASCQGSP
jgi:hypothetical protein